MWDKGEGGRVTQILVHGLLLSEYVNAFEEGTDESIGRRLQWQLLRYLLFFSLPLTSTRILFVFVLSLLHHQATQLAHILDGWLKDLVEDAGRGKALKDVAMVTTKDKEKVAATAEKKAAVFEKASVVAEKRSLELEVKLGVAEQKLTKAASLNTAWEGELANLKATLEACENKWYNEGFANAENSTEPVILEAESLVSRRVGWLPYRP